MPEQTKCSRCGIDLDWNSDVGTTMCGWCECDIRNAQRRANQEAKPGSLHPACSAARWSARLIFAWYDLWVGIFWDSRKRKLYILPVPCVGVVIEFPMRQNDQAERPAGGNYEA